MSNILQAIKLTRRLRRAEAAEQRRHSPPRELVSHCRALLDEAKELGLELDDVIDALRRHSHSNKSSN